MPVAGDRRRLRRWRARPAGAALPALALLAGACCSVQIGLASRVRECAVWTPGGAAPAGGDGEFLLATVPDPETGLRLVEGRSDTWFHGGWLYRRGAAGWERGTSLAGPWRPVPDGELPAGLVGAPAAPPPRRSPEESAGWGTPSAGTLDRTPACWLV